MDATITPLWQRIIDKYYSDNPALRHILVVHSRSVADAALEIARRHPELPVDTGFLEEAAMLHDIGIFKTHAPGIQCFGDQPYICHGLLGGELLRSEGLPRHARVAERHTGTGLTAEDIRRQGLPLPVFDYVPETVEEQIICYADKFFSKTRLDHRKTADEALRSLMKFGDGSVRRMTAWIHQFGA